MITRKELGSLQDYEKMELSIPLEKMVELHTPPPQNVFWHVCSGGSCFFWGSK